MLAQIGAKWRDVFTAAYAEAQGVDIGEWLCTAEPGIGSRVSLGPSGMYLVSAMIE
jgi:hypothetical protein